MLIFLHHLNWPSKVSPWKKILVPALTRQIWMRECFLQKQRWIKRLIWISLNIAHQTPQNQVRFSATATTQATLQSKLHNTLSSERSSRLNSILSVKWPLKLSMDSIIECQLCVLSLSLFLPFLVSTWLWCSGGSCAAVLRVSGVHHQPMRGVGACWRGSDCRGGHGGWGSVPREVPVSTRRPLGSQTLRPPAPPDERRVWHLARQRGEQGVCVCVCKGRAAQVG